MNDQRNSNLFIDSEKSKEQLLDELKVLQHRIAELEKDVAERKITEELLKREKYNKQQYLNIAGVIFVAIDKHKKVSLINKKGCEILGYNQEEIIGKDWFDTFLPESIRDRTSQVYEKLMTGDIESAEYFINSVLTRKGEERIIAWHNTVDTDDSGDIIGTISSGEDITECKKTENSLHKHQAMLMKDHKQLQELFQQVEVAKKEWESSMDCVRDMVILIDDSGQVKRCNKTFKDFVDRPYAQILNSEWEELFAELKLDPLTFFAGSEEMHHKPTGRSFLLNSYSFKDSNTKMGFSGSVITIHDNTKTKQVTEELKYKNEEIEKNREKLQCALNEISRLMHNVTEKKVYKMECVNPNLVKCYEVKHCTKKECYCYGRKAMRCWLIVGTHCNGKTQGTFDNKYTNCLECEVFEKATSDPVYEIGEQFNNMMHVLEMKNNELENAYKELKAAQAGILQQEKMASIGQLAAGVAHEINNPMGFISSNIRSLKKYSEKLIEFIGAQNKIVESLSSEESSDNITRLKKTLKIDYISEDIHMLIEESLDGADRVKKIVQNLKSFSRIDEAEFKPADINECIESTLNIVWNEIKYKATVEKKYGELPLIKCYAQQLNQVLMNLLVNAAQALKNQGEIRIETWHGDGIINILISDSGCGIPEDKIHRIFEPFFTTKDVGKGTGLGLSIVYDIVKKHNGEITVNSKEGRGSTFHMKLPVLEEDKSS